MFDVVDSNDATDNIIATGWVLIEKEKHDGTKVTKARLCLRGDMEKSLHKICKGVANSQQDVSQDPAVHRCQPGLGDKNMRC